MGLHLIIIVEVKVIFKTLSLQRDPMLRKDKKHDCLCLKLHLHNVFVTKYP